MSMTELGGRFLIAEGFAQRTIDDITRKNRFWASGAVAKRGEVVDLIDATRKNGGVIINLPTYVRLSGRSTAVGLDTKVIPTQLHEYQTRCPILTRVTGFTENDLRDAIQKTDTMGVISSMLSDYWAKEDSQMLNSILKGLFATNTAGKESLLPTHTVDISGEAGAGAEFNSTSLIKGAYKVMKEKTEDMAMLVVDSLTMGTIHAKNQITTIPMADGKTFIKRYAPLDLEMIVDDYIDNNLADDVHDAYICGKHAFNYGETTYGFKPIELTRTADTGMGQETVFSRRMFAIGVNGVDYNGGTGAGGIIIDDARLEAVDSWVKKAPNENIKIMKYRFKL